MFEKIYNILVSFLGESKQGEYDSSIDQYQFNCPRCKEENGGIPDGKFNLEVNLKIQKFQCWRCAESDGTKGRISFLIKKYGSKRMYQDYKTEIENLRKLHLYDLEDFEAVKEITETFVFLPKTYTKIDLNTLTDRRLISYLEKRKIDQKTIDRFHLGYTTWDEDNYKLRNRLIIPSYDGFGDLNFWVGRDYTGKQFAKYMNCEADKKNIIFQESLIDWDAPIYLVEGAIDCLRYPNSIALLGKTLKRDYAIYDSIVKKANSDIVICLDADTDENETKRIYSILNFGRLKGKIRYIRMGEATLKKDFSEVYEKEGIRGMINLVKKKKEYNEIDLIW